MVIYKVCSKSIEAEAVFTTTEMNNEWNVNFLQNTNTAEKSIEIEAAFTNIEVMKKETLIFFKKQGYFRKYRD